MCHLTQTSLETRPKDRSIDDDDDAGKSTDDPVRGPRSSSSGQSSINTDQSKENSNLEDFHVFTWLSLVPRSSDRPTETQSKDEATEKPDLVGGDPQRRKSAPNQMYSLDGAKMNESLTTALKFLWKNPKLKERKAFRKCSSRTKEEVHKLWRKGSKKNKFQSERNILGIFPAAKVMLQFFMPLDSEAVIVQKFWGAVYLLLETEVTFTGPPDSDCADAKVGSA